MREVHNEIENLESKLIQDKPWHLKGEIKASQRPVNSLLEVQTPFKSN